MLAATGPALCKPWCTGRPCLASHSVVSSCCCSIVLLSGFGALSCTCRLVPLQCYSVSLPAGAVQTLAFDQLPQVPLPMTASC